MNKYFLIWLVAIIFFPSLAFSTCYYFEEAGQPLPKAELCFEGECKIIHLEGFCGGMTDNNPYTSSSFSIPNGQGLTRACTNSDKGTKCDWKIDGLNVSPASWVKGACTNKSQEETESETDPCYQLRLHYD